MSAPTHMCAQKTHTYTETHRSTLPVDMPSFISLSATTTTKKRLKREVKGGVLKGGN